ncbi:MAG TPA: GNAT family N-acetyltransferase [bacterium]|nr:GNAT family N-acetyltransferase [bacterium]
MNPSEGRDVTGFLEYRVARLEEIIGLREEVLIKGTDRVSPEFQGDRNPTTLHFGAFHQGRAVGCLTFLLNEWQGEPAWQLRGMATDAAFRGKGIGRHLLRFAENHLLHVSPVRRLWCNARSGAAGFYEKLGWRRESDEFLIEGVGPHYKMSKTLAKRI